MSALSRPRLAFLLAAAVLLTFAVSVFPKSASAQVHEITAGELNWGLKESWRNYVGGAAVSDGATTNPDGTTKYPLVSGTYDDETRTTELQFAGSSWYRSWWEFTAPGKWALDTTVKDLKLVISPTEQILRGTIIGYSQADPGGELHEDIDVVLAQLLLDDNQGISFDDGKSVYNGVAAVAGAKLGLYSAGTPLDRVTVKYDGAGGVPDTSEKLGNPGDLSLEEAPESFLSDWERETHTQSNRALYASQDGEQLDLIELKSSNSAASALRFTRLDADTLEPVGEELVYDDFPSFQGPNSVTQYGRYFRMDQNTETGEIFFAKGGQGDDKLGTWIFRALWNESQGKYVVDKVGEMPDATFWDATTLINAEVGPVVWNDVLNELQVIGGNPDTTDLYDAHSLYRFRQVDGSWQREVTPIRAPDAGEYADANRLTTPWSLQSNDVTTTTVAVARDGSLIFPSKTALIRHTNPQGGNVITRLPGAQIKVAGSQVTARYIPGTMLGNHPSYNTYYGWTNASESHDGSVLIHNSQWGTATFVRVDIVDGDAKVVGPIYESEDMMPPYQVGTLGRIIAPDKVNGWDWVVDVTDTEQRVLNAFHQVDGEDVMFSRQVQREYAEGAVFGNPPLVRENGDVYLTVRDPDTQRAKVIRMQFLGKFASFDEVPEDRNVSLATGEGSKAVSFTSTIEGGDPAPTRQWQVKPAGESHFVDIEGETDETLEVDAVRTDNGNLYRALYTSDAGRIATEPASLEVRFAPYLVNEPADVNVTAGNPATIVAMPAGNPFPDVLWQVRLNGIWQAVDLDTGQFTVSGEHGGFLAISDTNVDMTGLRFRARLRNQITPGSDEQTTTYSREATLRVSAAETERIYFDSKSSKADWGVSNRYRCYVTGNIGRGWIEVEGGAEQVPGTTPTGGLCAGTNSTTGKPWGTGGESFRFGLGSAVFPEVGDEPLSPIYDPENNRLRVDLAGTVRFLGHTYHAPGDTTPLLKTELSNMRIEANLDSGEGFVYVDAVGTNMDSDVPLNVTGVKIAQFDASAISLNPVDGRITVADVPTFLHQEGVQIFGNYPVGEPMDPLNLDLVVGVKPERPEQPKPPVGKVRAPVVKKLSVAALKGNTAVVRVVCPAAAKSGCRITAPKRTRLVSAGKASKQVRSQLKRGAVIAAPKKLAAGKAATVRLKLTVKQRRALRNRAVTARFRLVSASVGGKVDRRAVVVRSKVRQAARGSIRHLSDAPLTLLVIWPP